MLALPQVRSGPRGLQAQGASAPPNHRLAPEPRSPHFLTVDTEVSEVKIFVILTAVEAAQGREKDKLQRRKPGRENQGIIETKANTKDQKHTVPTGLFI